LIIVRHARIRVLTASSGQAASYGNCAERVRRDIVWKGRPRERTLDAVDLIIPIKIALNTQDYDFNGKEGVK